MKSSKAAIAKPKNSYHHGELPGVLMALALDHIEASGTEKLSLRALAREAGVSQTAPYRHFPTKRCLLAALATKGFVSLRESMRLAMDDELTVQGRFIAMGEAYVRFALDNPTTYQLMFGAVLGDFSDYDMLHDAAAESYDQVLETLRALIAENNLDEDPMHLGGVVWSGVHGMASLLLQGKEKAALADASAKAAADATVPEGPPPAAEPRPIPSAPQSISLLGADINKSLRSMFGHLLR